MSYMTDASSLSGTRGRLHRTFMDTNIFVYADDLDSPAKQQRAQELIADQRRAGTGDAR